MSTAYALAATTAVLRSRLTSSFAAAGVSAAIGGVTVVTQPPDRVRTGAQETNQLNVFLHRATRNPAWANLGPPPRSAAGDAVAEPLLGLDLHYLVSAYGADAFATEILLGHAMLAFHDEPVLTRAAIRRALAPNPPDPSVPAPVAGARLADQLESLRITPMTPDPEAVARLWSTFQSPYRPSAFYEVAVVLVEPSQRGRSPFPVRSIGAATVAADEPEVGEVVADGPEGAPIVVGATLVVNGSGLAGPGVQVRLGASTAIPTEIGERRLAVALADFVPPPRAGVHGLVVTHEIDLGDPPVPHRASSSGAVAVGLRPTLTFTAGAVDTASTATVDGVATATGTVTATVAPAVGREQQVQLLLAEVGAPPDRPPRGTTLVAPAGNGVGAGATETTTVAFAYTRVPRGTYVARLRVDGVESPVGIDANGRIAEPAVVL